MRGGRLEAESRIEGRSGFVLCIDEHADASGEVDNPSNSVKRLHQENFSIAGALPCAGDGETSKPNRGDLVW